MPLVAIIILLSLFYFWTWMLVRVHREFRDAPDEGGPMTLTFYTLGFIGPFLLRGLQGKDPALTKWVDKIAGGRPGHRVVVTGELEASAPDVTLTYDDESDEPAEVEIEQETKNEVPSAAKLILQGAIRERASDVHLEPGPGWLKVRCRLDGMLQPRGEHPAETGTRVVAALKVLAGMDIAEKRRPQEGSFKLVFGGRPVEVRVSTVGTDHGEKMVMRILDRRVGLRRLKDLGFRRPMQDQLHAIVTRQHGMLVVCGPTGSGKTTTLYGALQEVDRASLNVITIENPIEYRLDGIAQHSVNLKADITFASLLRTSLHQDPDILMVGEVRDRETAEIAMEAAMTGHFVYTTVHANDAVAALYRFRNLDVPTYAIATSLTAILAQRLMRRLCKACREERKPTAEELARLGLEEEEIEVFGVAKGCDDCNGTGYKGRIGVYELLVLDDELRALLSRDAPLGEVKDAARKAGLVPLRTDALTKAVAGITSVEEAARVTA